MLIDANGVAMIFNWLRRLLTRKQPGFRFEILEPGIWRCRACVPNRMVWEDQLGFHAKTKHGWKAPNVRITSRNQVPL